MFSGFQIDASCLTWEGQQFQGKAAIVEKLSVSKGQGHAASSCFPALLATAHHPLFLLQSLPFQKIQHSITAQDHQPTPDSCIISMVVGQLKVIVLVGRSGQAEESPAHLPSL